MIALYHSFIIHTHRRRPVVEPSLLTASDALKTPRRRRGSGVNSVARAGLRCSSDTSRTWSLILRANLNSAMTAPISIAVWYHGHDMVTGQTIRRSMNDRMNATANAWLNCLFYTWPVGL